jgi:hypothetical protein
MALIDEKKDVFTTIGAYTSLNEAATPPNSTNLFPSVNNKKDIIPLLLDLLTVVVGTDALQELTGKLFTNLITKIEPDLKKSVKSQNIQSNSGNQIPNSFATNGYDVKVKDIDIFGKLKSSPVSTTGSLLYSNNHASFDNVLYQTLLTGNATFGSTLAIKYNATTDAFNFKPTPAFATAKVGDFLNGFVDDMELINKKQFMSQAMNLFYGSITTNQNKTVEQIAQELQVAKLLQQLINDDDSFVLSPEDYEAILRKAQELANGVTYYDLGCGVMEVVFPLSGMTDLISNISGSTDPFFVGNQVNATIAQSTKNTPDTSAANKQTIKSGFFQKLIDLITQTLANAICTSPQIRALLAISSAFSNFNISQIGNPLTDLKKFKIFLKCNLNTAMALINKFIYDLVITFLIALITPIIKKIIKEKINQYSKQIKSLIAPSIPIANEAD